MGNIAQSSSLAQTTKNFQSTTQYGNATSTELTGKGASNAVNGGISLIFNNGGNKVTATKSTTKAAKSIKGVTKSTPVNSGSIASDSIGMASPVPNGGGGSSPLVGGTGNVDVSISSPDASAVTSLADVTNEALGVVGQAVTGLSSVASQSLLAGTQTAALAIPTYAADEVAGQQQQPSEIFVGSGSGSPTSTLDSPILWGIGAVAIGLTLAWILRNK